MYIMAKLILIVVRGLFIGRTFFKAELAGRQNQVFAIFMATILRYGLFSLCRTGG